MSQIIMEHSSKSILYGKVQYYYQQQSCCISLVVFPHPPSPLVVKDNKSDTFALFPQSNLNNQEGDKSKPIEPVQAHHLVHQGLHLSQRHLHREPDCVQNMLSGSEIQTITFNTTMSEMQISVLHINSRNFESNFSLYMLHILV